eukprot:COSAG02_NODE_1478_length_12404_cov_353.335067_5_plen_103_part_00
MLAAHRSAAHTERTHTAGEHSQQRCAAVRQTLPACLPAFLLLLLQQQPVVLAAQGLRALTVDAAYTLRIVGAGRACVLGCSGLPGGGRWRRRKARSKGPGSS